jgi:CRP-like cAMP-binding protein
MAALLARSVERAHGLAFQQVATHAPGLDTRLLTLLWLLADRWGRVTRDGVLVPLQLTHVMIAELVGASRPSVSTALKGLETRSSLLRTRDGWLLCDATPESMPAAA